MGAFFGSIHIKSDDRETVKAAAMKLSAEKGIRFLIGPALNGWVGVYAEDRGQDSEIGRILANDLTHDIVQFMVYDDDIFQYWYYRDGRLVDHYYSKPGYFDEEGAELAQQKALKGKPEVFRDLIGDDCLKLKKVLSRSRGLFTFESERLAKIARILKIPNTSAGYEDLKAGERYQIKGWRKFEEIPAAVDLEPTARENERVANKSKWKELRDNEVLLMIDQKSWASTKACRLRDGLLVAWLDYHNDITSVDEFFSPWERSTKSTEDLPNVIVTVDSTPDGKRIVIGSRQSLEIWDVAKEKWSFVTDINDSKFPLFSSISMSGRFVLHGSKENVSINGVDDKGTSVRWPATDRTCGAIHPSDEWAVVGGETLQVIPMNGDPHWIEASILTTRPANPSMVKMLSSFNLEEFEAKQRGALEVEMEGIVRRSGESVSSEMINAIRLGKERAIELSITRLKAIQKGESPLENVSRESINCVGFSRGGEWLWCGTDTGLLIYRWSAIPRETGQPLPVPKWRVESSSPVRSIAEVNSEPAILFGESNGRISRLDLITGIVEHILQLPTGISVKQIVFSKDGDVLGILCHEYETFKFELRKQIPQSTWCIFSYEKLKRGMEKVSQ